MERSPRQPKDFYKVLYPVAKFVLDLSYHQTVLNPENILDEPAIYAANHVHAADSPLLSKAYTDNTGLPLRFVMKHGYAAGTGIDDKGKLGRTAKFIVNHTRQIPVFRGENDVASFKLFEDRVAQTLARGDSVGIHPEGTRSKDGKLSKFKAGAARLAINNSVPIVPVGIVYNSGSKYDKQDVDILFGEPVYPEQLERVPYGDPTDIKAKAQYLSQVIEDRVSKLSGLEQSGNYARSKNIKKD